MIVIYNGNRIISELPKHKGGANKGRIDRGAMVGKEIDIQYNEKIYNVKIEDMIKSKNGNKFVVLYEGDRSEILCCELVNRNNFNKIFVKDEKIIKKAPWMIDLGMSEEDAKKYTCGSGVKVEVACPMCGHKKLIRIYDLHRFKTIRCVCGDGFSYPEKMVSGMLSQLSVEFCTQYNPKWSKNKRYDFYIPKLNMIIEVHGLQHYKQSYTMKDINVERKNDILKEKLAKENGIDEYVVIDCRISDLEYIKVNILKSELSKHIELSNIDWFKCEEYALSNRVKEICNYWNGKDESESVTDLVKIFGIKSEAIRNYLKRGTRLGWCKYDAEYEIIKARSKSWEVESNRVNIYKIDRTNPLFLCTANGQRGAVKIIKDKYGVNVTQSNIYAVLNGKARQYKGFYFVYSNKDNVDETLNIIKNIKVKARNDTSINIYELREPKFIAEANEGQREAREIIENLYGIKINHINEVLKGERSHTKGFYFTYSKEDDIDETLKIIKQKREGGYKNV